MSEIVRFGISPETKPRSPKWALAWYRSRPWHSRLMSQIRDAQFQNNAKTLNEFRASGFDLVKEFVKKNSIKELMVINHQLFLDIELTPEVTMFILQYESKK